jgi:Tol biopolymer transport system component
MDADGGNKRLLYDSPDYEWGARWSADGLYIIFTTLRNNINSIYIMDADGSNVRLITDRGSYPAWVP